jgi:hypothetical protein
MNRLMRSVLLLGALATLATGCVNKYTVVRQAAPNPLSPDRHLVLAPLQFDGLTIDELPEADWRARRTPQQNASFDGDKHFMVARFGERLAQRLHDAGLSVVSPGEADEQTLTIRPVLHKLTMGYYGFIVGDDSHADLTVQIVDAGNNVLDEIAVHSAGKADESGISFTDRLGKAARKAADLCAKYLAERASTAPRRNLAQKDQPHRADSTD